MRHIDLDIRPMAWASHVKIDGEEMPCSRIAVICDPASGNNETRVELTYDLIGETGSYHQPAIELAGCLLEPDEYARFDAMRAALEAVRDAARGVNPLGHRVPERPELAEFLPAITAALGEDQ